MDEVPEELVDEIIAHVDLRTMRLLEILLRRKVSAAVRARVLRAHLIPLFQRYLSSVSKPLPPASDSDIPIFDLDDEGYEVLRAHWEHPKTLSLPNHVIEFVLANSALEPYLFRPCHPVCHLDNMLCHDVGIPSCLPRPVPAALVRLTVCHCDNMQGTCLFRWFVVYGLAQQLCRTEHLLDGTSGGRRGLLGQAHRESEYVHPGHFEKAAEGGGPRVQLGKDRRQCIIPYVSQYGGGWSLFATSRNGDCASRRLWTIESSVCVIFSDGLVVDGSGGGLHRFSSLKRVVHPASLWAAGGVHTRSTS